MFKNLRKFFEKKEETDEQQIPASAEVKEDKPVQKETFSIIPVDRKRTHEEFLKSALKENLDNKTVYLVDFENTGKIPKNVFQDKQNVVLVFVGNTQMSAFKNHIKSIAGVAKIYPVYSEKTGKNYLDNKLSLYAGMVMGRYVPEKLYIVSNDDDYALIHLSLKESGTEFTQIKPNENMTSIFEPNQEYMNRLMRDIFYKYPLGLISRKNLRKTISQSKLDTIHPVVIDQIIGKLLKTKFLRLIETGKYKGCYKVEKSFKPKTLS